MLRIPILSDSFIASDRENFEKKDSTLRLYVIVITKLIPSSKGVLSNTLMLINYTFLSGKTILSSNPNTRFHLRNYNVNQ